MLTSNRLRHPSLSIERICFYLACIVATLPLWFSHYPPMVDAPQHAAQVATLKALLTEPGYIWRDYFEINWLRPYWGAYLPLMLLTSIMPLYMAIKVLLALIVISIPLSVSRLRASFGGNPAIDWLALPVSYGFAFQWGFITFLLGVPLALLYLTQVFRYADNPDRRMAWFLAAGGFGLFFIHVLIAAFALGMSAVYLLAGTQSLRKKTGMILPLAAWLPLALCWLIIRIKTGGHVSHPGPWDLSWSRPGTFLSDSIAEPFGIRSLFTGLLVYTLPFLLGFRLTQDRRRLAMFATLFLWIMFGPNYFIGNFFTSNRFSIFGIPFFILLLEAPASLSLRQKAGLMLLYSLPLVLLASHCMRFSLFDLETRGYREISRQMQPHKRTLGLIINNSSLSYNGFQHLHMPLWYQAESGGLVDASFAIYQLQASYRKDAPVLREYSFEWAPLNFDWFHHQGWRYDYFVTRYSSDPAQLLFAHSSCPVELVAHQGEWWLFHNDKTRCIEPGQQPGSLPDP